MAFRLLFWQKKAATPGWKYYGQLFLTWFLWNTYDVILVMMNVERFIMGSYSDSRRCITETKRKFSLGFQASRPNLDLCRWAVLWYGNYSCIISFLNDNLFVQIFTQILGFLQYMYYYFLHVINCFNEQRTSVRCIWLSCISMLTIE